MVSELEFIKLMGVIIVNKLVLAYFLLKKNSCNP